MCWHGTDRGLLVVDDELGVLVHKHCLDFFGVETVREYEKKYIDE